jgi:hypothetical protein
MHIVSNVEGTAEAGANALACCAPPSPAGTVSGAPKVRAMEIIDELEPVKRGIYAGAVGYLGFHGDMDLAIAIRTAVVKDGRIHVQAGAGIVADSDPAQRVAGDAEQGPRPAARRRTGRVPASTAGLGEEHYGPHAHYVRCAHRGLCLPRDGPSGGIAMLLMIENCN